MILNTEPWMNRAACLTEWPELFFPDKKDKRGAEAKAICRTRCPVMDECLAYALASDFPLIGIFGGTSEHERRGMRRAAS